MSIPSTSRSVIVGVAGGLTFAGLDILVQPQLPDELLAAAYAVILILISIPFVPAARLGALCGISALITQTVGEVLYNSSAYGIGLAIGVLPYDLLFLYRLVSFPVAGALAGYLSRKI